MLSKENSIEVLNVSKCYQSYKSPLKHLTSVLLSKNSSPEYSGVRHNDDGFWALHDISFTLPRGRTLGVVGKNGSGKSTLLQIIAGTLTPTEGSVNIEGRVAALLELGAGFNIDFTGIENIYLNATLLGLSRSEVDTRLDSILSFADIGHFINSPVRAYSSGMLVRLAFAIQAQLDPDILIVDEALAVGDAKFQAKCFNRLKKLKDNGTSILFVSHATEQIVTHCDSAILLNDGKLITEDKPKIVVNKYLDILFGKSKKQTVEKQDNEFDLPEVKLDALKDFSDGMNFEQRHHYNPSEYRWGDGGARITDFSLTQGNKKYPVILEKDTEATFKFRVEFLKEMIRPIFGFAIKTKDGVTIYNTNTEIQACDFLPGATEGQLEIITVKMPVSLYQGDYFVSIGIASCDVNGEVIPHDRRYDSIHLTVDTTKEFIGLVNLEAKITCGL